MAKLTIAKAYNDLLAKGFAQADIDAAENHAVQRDFFLPSTPEEPKVYKAEEGKTKWVAQLVGTTITKEGEKPKKVVAWAVVYQENLGTAEAPNWMPRESISKSFLLAKSRINSDGVTITPKGSVREWADKNILSGVLDKEWTAKLATLLNEKGLRFEAEPIRLIRKADGRPFEVPFMHPYFAE